MLRHSSLMSLTHFGGGGGGGGGGIGLFFVIVAFPGHIHLFPCILPFRLINWDTYELMINVLKF